MINVAYFEPLPAVHAYAPENASLHLVTALTNIEKAAKTTFPDEFTWQSAITAIRQLRMGHGRAAAQIIAHLPEGPRRLLEKVCEGFALKLVVEERDLPPERHTMLRRVYDRGIVKGVPPRDITAGFKMSISSIDDLEVRREIEVLMHSVYAGDHIAVERIAEQMSFIARARLRTVLCTYSLTIWHPITYGPLWFLKL